MLNLKNKVVFKGDRTLWYVVIGLMLASLIVVYSSTGSLAFRVRGGNTSYYLIKQLFLMFGCMVVILTLQSFHYKYFVCQDRAGDVVDIPVVGEVCGYDVK